ncbi:MAG: L-glutamate gamma-semialdehyde dehydrogenase [Deltaproteobacteria bacterium]|nr:L-glutamate gamma-semialdehyde dehydrogenase [Deltaproteobacteria bacterium]
MIDSILLPPPPTNEPLLSYAPGTAERAALKDALGRAAATPSEFGHWIGGRDVSRGERTDVRAPHDHALLLARRPRAGVEEARLAVDAAIQAQTLWGRMPLASRAAVFLKAAELLATKYRHQANAVTMLGQSKTAWEAEIDTRELIDFWRFNVAFAARIQQEQPHSPPGTWNQLEPRPLEGFVLAVTPFNFTSIAGNLPTAPAIMGNTVVWKPAETAVLSARLTMDVLTEAGLPAGVINMVLGPGSVIGPACLQRPELAGVHFTGSTSVFQGIWKTVGERLAHYRNYPRLVGETGGKDFIFAHPSADLDALAVAMIRGAFEYQGQKCSAASRAYVPASLWPRLKDRLIGLVSELRMGDISDFRNFMGAVIDQKAWRDITAYIDVARHDPDCKIVCGGGSSQQPGWFVEPTIVETSNPTHRLMVEEIFGPVLTVWPYEDARYEQALALVDSSSPYALTGAVFAQDRNAIEHARQVLRFAAGNFYVNDKPTGAVVGQQPFGGGRASGTNDKAGSIYNMLRWTSPRAIKENFNPPTDYRYPFMSER